MEIRVDDGPPDHFAVMGGIGIDAVIMEGTNPDLKKAVGSAAYFVSAARNANHPALHTTIQVDDAPPLRRRAHVIVVGNVGLPAGQHPADPGRQVRRRAAGRAWSPRRGRPPTGSGSPPAC